MIVYRTAKTTMLKKIGRMSSRIVLTTNDVHHTTRCHIDVLVNLIMRATTTTDQ